MIWNALVLENRTGLPMPTSAKTKRTASERNKPVLATKLSKNSNRPNPISEKLQTLKI
jgi:hypothetical protein